MPESFTSAMSKTEEQTFETDWFEIEFSFSKIGNTSIWDTLSNQHGEC